MDQHLRSAVNDLRNMSSSDAADWLMVHHPVDSKSAGEALIIASHLSWKKADQLRLADYYLSKLPFASARPYEVFASMLPIHKLIAILRDKMPNEEADRDLLWYHAGPVLTRAAKTTQDHEAVQTLMSEVSTS